MTLASVVSPARRAATPGRRRPPGGPGVTTTCMSAIARPARGDPVEHPLRRGERRGGQHRHRAGATTGRPGPPPAGRGRRRRRPVAADAGAVHRGGVGRRDGVQGRASASRRTTTRQPTAVRRASVQSSTAIPAVAAAASVTGRCATQEVSAAAMPRASGRTPARGHVVGQVASGRAACARPPRATTSEPGDGVAARRSTPQARGWRAPGSRSAATSRRSGEVDRDGRSRWSRPADDRPKRWSVTAAPAPSRSRSAVRELGQREHAGQLGGAEPDRQHVVVPAGGQADAGRRGRPDGVAGRGHVQLGEDVLEVDRRDGVELVGGQPGRAPRPRGRRARARPASTARARPGSGPPLRRALSSGPPADVPRTERSGEAVTLEISAVRRRVGPSGQRKPAPWGAPAPPTHHRPRFRAGTGAGTAGQAPVQGPAASVRAVGQRGPLSRRARPATP